MVSTRRKLQILGSFGILLLMAVAVGCHGFFVDPVLQGISVSTLQSTTLTAVGNSVQLLATGSFDDGSNKNLTGSATWSVSPTGFISLSTTTPGLATATQVTNPGTAVTVQAAAQSSNGTVVKGTLTLTAGASSTLTITSSPVTPIGINASGGTGATVTFAATLNGNNVTGSTSFSSSNSAIINITSPTSGTGTLGGTTGSVIITGTDSADGASGTTTIQVNQ
jgi:hypothetical protein